MDVNYKILSPVKFNFWRFPTENFDEVDDDDEYDINYEDEKNKDLK